MLPRLLCCFFFFFNDTATPEIYTLSLHDALPILYGDAATKQNDWAFHYLPKVDRNYSWAYIWDDMYRGNVKGLYAFGMNGRSEEHTSELQSQSNLVCRLLLEKKKNKIDKHIAARE